MRKCMHQNVVRTGCVSNELLQFVSAVKMLIIVVTGEAAPMPLYSTVYTLCPHSHKIAKDGTTSGPGPEPPPMDNSTRRVVQPGAIKPHIAVVLARAATHQASRRVRAPSRALARECIFLCLISCREQSHPTDQDDIADETREKERKGKRKKKMGAPDNHMGL